MDGMRADIRREEFFTAEIYVLVVVGVLGPYETLTIKHTPLPRRFHTPFHALLHVVLHVHFTPVFTPSPRRTSARGKREGGVK
jgi:hypothetical protein